MSRQNASRKGATTQRKSREYAYTNNRIIALIPKLEQQFSFWQKLIKGGLFKMRIAERIGWQLKLRRECKASLALPHHF